MWAVVGARWWLRDRNLPCGPAAIANHLRQDYPELALPSLRTVARIIAEIDLPETGSRPYDT